MNKIIIAILWMFLVIATLFFIITDVLSILSATTLFLGYNISLINCRSIEIKI